MSNNSEFLDKAREEANAAFDDHCKQWELLQELASPTIEDLTAWLAARDSFFEAQEKFEDIVRQISAR
ncbi:hypothetical protein [Pseudomonas baetica]|uniref:hypothetical protein n=1 Tax=Pseudomonas baetica TaxID=674054 RepID=UPI00287110ED|nr:hypothetical protein [Pseudomonas baetica]MDR9863444.1 hypothetical protein [Pseudomonas baetica]